MWANAVRSAPTNAALYQGCKGWKVGAYIAILALSVSAIAVGALAYSNVWSLQKIFSSSIAIGTMSGGSVLTVVLGTLGVMALKGTALPSTQGAPYVSNNDSQDGTNSSTEEPVPDQSPTDTPPSKPEVYRRTIRIGSHSSRSMPQKPTSIKEYQELFASDSAEYFLHLEKIPPDRFFLTVYVQTSSRIKQENLPQGVTYTKVVENNTAVTVNGRMIYVCAIEIESCIFTERPKGEINDSRLNDIVLKIISPFYDENGERVPKEQAASWPKPNQNQMQLLDNLFTSLSENEKRNFNLNLDGSFIQNPGSENGWLSSGELVPLLRLIQRNMNVYAWLLTTAGSARGHDAGTFISKLDIINKFSLTAHNRDWFIPYNTGNHWILIHVNKQKQQIVVYDPMGNEDVVRKGATIEGLINKINEVQQVNGKKEFAIITPFNKNFYLQTDIYNCGVWTYYLMKCILTMTDVQFGTHLKTLNEKRKNNQKNNENDQLMKDTRLEMLQMHLLHNHIRKELFD